MLRSPVVPKIVEEIMESIEVVFQHFSQLDGFRAERLGDAMRVLGMSPTEDQDGPPAAMMCADCHSCYSSGSILICRSGSTWKILGGPSTLTKGRFTISSRTQGLGRVPCLANLAISFCSKRVFVKVLVCLLLQGFPQTRFSDFNRSLIFHRKLQHLAG